MGRDRQLLSGKGTLCSPLQRTPAWRCSRAVGDPMTIRPSFLFDLDGTLVDSVYEHVLAWQEALTAEGIELSVWRTHRKIGMSGGLFTNQLLREGITSSSYSFSKRITS